MSQLSRHIAMRSALERLAPGIAEQADLLNANRARIEKVLMLLAQGKTASQASRMAGIPLGTIMHLTTVNLAFAAAYKEARDIGTEHLAEECLEIADDTGGDAKLNSRGQPVIDGEAIARSALRINTRLKLASYWKPERYANRVLNEHTGKDGSPIELTVRAEAITDTLSRLREAKRTGVIDGVAVGPGLAGSAGAKSLGIAPERAGQGGMGRVAGGRLGDPPAGIELNAGIPAPSPTPKMTSKNSSVDVPQGAEHGYVFHAPTRQKTTSPAPEATGAEDCSDIL